VIAITRLDGAAMWLNIDLIESIEATPDTLVSMVNGDKLFVRESPAELVARVLSFKRAIFDSDGGRVPRVAGQLDGIPWR
jgi:flagellar protein FlbD